MVSSVKVKVKSSGRLEQLGLLDRWLTWRILCTPTLNVNNLDTVTSSPHRLLVVNYHPAKETNIAIY